MKTYKHLYEKMIDREYIEGRILFASSGKRHRRLVKRIIENPDPTIDKIINKLESGTWEPAQHETTKLREGSHKKERQIQKPQFDDEQIVHHMLVGVLRPIIEPQFYEWSCGSVPGRGPLLVMKTMRKWLKQLDGKPIYVAELDIKKFYQHINAEILKSQLSRIIKDDKYLDILFKVIDGEAPGLPLGFYTSPWLGNYYLTPLDRYILHTLHPIRYMRYMDNMFLFDDDKEKLHAIVEKIRQFSNDNLKLTIKKDWQVFRFEYIDKNGKTRGRPINCLGFVIHHNRTTLRKSLLKRIRAKSNRVHSSKLVRLMDARALVSYSGWLSHTDTYDYYCKYVKPKVSFQFCKKMISKDQKRSNEHDKLENCSRQRETSRN